MGRREGYGGGGAITGLCGAYKPTSVATGIIQSARSMVTIRHGNIGNKIDWRLLVLFVSLKIFIRTRVGGNIGCLQAEKCNGAFFVGDLAVVTTYNVTSVSMHGNFY